MIIMQLIILLSEVQYNKLNHSSYEDIIFNDYLRMKLSSLIISNEKKNYLNEFKTLLYI